MLTQISIHNFALIDQLHLEFDQGLNVLTGETGAGKSILIDALRICIGERMESSFIRDVEKPCKIEVAFHLQNILLKSHPLVQDFLSDGDDYLICKREIISEGKSKTTINHKIVNVSTLKKIGALFVDFHGQFDHQQLLDVSTHRDILDRFADVSNELSVYAKIFEQYQKLHAELKGLNQNSGNVDDQIDLLQYQINEIESAGIKEGEEDQLHEEHIRLSHSEKLRDITASLLIIFEQGEQAVSDQIQHACGFVTELSTIDESAEQISILIDQVQINAEELIVELNKYQENLALDSQDVDQVISRLDLIQEIKRKYGKSVDEINLFLENAQKKLDVLLHKEEVEAKLNKEITLLIPKMDLAAKEITKKRSKAALFLKKNIEKELHELGMDATIFECVLEKSNFHVNGKEMIEFFISPNKGEELKPLTKIVSGGEAARIMLAFKKVLVKVDPIPTLIFDEIDSNIGGRLGKVVGEKLKSIAKERQVLLITHLPQIASYSDHHIKIHKEVKQGKTFTNARTLNAEERIEEIAHMLSGEDNKTKSAEYAKELIASAGHL